ncbi:MAG: type II toxin-antitoxin system YafQ family toxin [Neisseria sp.]|nr:type II toxin-antitoxin system YafQ family toxin [Neisseria sp.]
MSKPQSKIIRISNQFKRDLKKQYLLLVSPEWVEVFGTLVKGGVLPEKYRDHQLTGNFHNYRKCHIKPDLLLLYAVHEDELHLVRLGTHAELFR